MKLQSYLFPVSIFFLSAVFLPHRTIAQPKIKEDLYVFDGNWKPTIIEKAKFFISVRKLGDSVWQWDTYHFKGPIIRMETFTDHDGKNLNGNAYYYTETGELDSIARFKNGLKDGTFFHLVSHSDTLIWVTKYVYAADTLVSNEPIDRHRKDEDSVNSKESSYPGGMKKWTAFIADNMEYPKRASNDHIDGLVRVLFSVDETGKVGEIYLGRSVEYSLDREVERVIRKSGNWIPATKNGGVVKSWKQQPVKMKMQW